MIKTFTEAWVANRQTVRAKFEAAHPAGYAAIVRAVVEMLHAACDEPDKPDPERIHQINDGKVSGDIVFVIGSTGLTRLRYWYMMISYGSCDVCDTLRKIRSFEYGEKPNPRQLEDYMTLALHVVQDLRLMK
jgi:hypothetical protein